MRKLKEDYWKDKLGVKPTAEQRKILDAWDDFVQFVEYKRDGDTIIVSTEDDDYEFDSLDDMIDSMKYDIEQWIEADKQYGGDASDWDSSYRSFKESFWEPTEYFLILSDMVNSKIDINTWNNASREERDAMVEPIVREFWKKYGKKIYDADREQELLDDLTDNNYHTEARLLLKIMQSTPYAKLGESMKKNERTFLKESKKIALKEDMTEDELRNELENYISELEPVGKVWLWNMYGDETNLTEDNVYEMSEFDELLSGMTPWEVARAAYYGDFCPAHDWWKFNVYGNLESNDYVDDFIDIDAIIDFIIDNDNDLDSSEIRAILEEASEGGVDESLKNLKENFSIVDLETGDHFGNFDSVDSAKSKAQRYSSQCRAKCAVVDDKYNAICGYNGDGKEIEVKGVVDEALNERNLTRAERHNRDMERIFSYKRATDDAMKAFLIKNGVSEEEAEDLRKKDKLDIKLRDMGLHDEFFKEWSKKESLTEANKGQSPEYPIEEMNLLYRYFDGLVSKLQNKDYAAHFVKPDEILKSAQAFQQLYYKFLKGLKSEEDLSKYGNLGSKFDFGLFNKPKKLSNFLDKIRNAGLARIKKYFKGQDKVINFVDEMDKPIGQALTYLDRLNAKPQTEGLKEDWESHEVTIGFCGYIGVEKSYSVYADSKSEAIEDALFEAADDLSVENIEDLGDGDYEVTVGFGGFIGVEEVYSVSADDEDEAEEYALEQARDDLNVIDIDGEEDVDESLTKSFRHLV